MEPVLAFLVFTRYGLCQDLIHRIKYEHRRDISRGLGRMYGRELVKDEYKLQADYLIPVPLHWKKRWKRGYNQAGEFASGLAEVLKIPVAHEGLIRVQHAKSQTTKTRYERWSIMDGQFTVNPDLDFFKKDILLVDDVITTGSTLGSCAEELYKAGASSVGCIALAVVR
jgi:ComF family protein